MCFLCKLCMFVCVSMSLYVCVCLCMCVMYEYSPLNQPHSRHTESLVTLALFPQHSGMQSHMTQLINIHKTWPHKQHKHKHFFIIGFMLTHIHVQVHSQLEYNHCFINGHNLFDYN